jgi:hypothetical protein
MSPIRARSTAALRRLRQGAATPRRLAVRIGKRRLVASVDPPRGVARVSVRPLEQSGTAAGSQPPRRLALTLRRRRLAAILNRATGTLEVRFSRVGPAQRPPARPPAPPRPAEPSIPVRPLVVEPPPLVVEAPEPPAVERPEAPLEPLRPRHRRAVWVVAALVAVALAAAGAGAATLLTRDESSESAATVPTAKPAPKPKTTTAPKPALAPARATTLAQTTTAPRQTTTAPHRTTTSRPATTTVVAGTRHAETKPAPPVASSAQTISWKPVAGAKLYLFEVLRKGSLGRTSVIQRWPAGPEFELPAGLAPGLYLWSASPQKRRGATIRSTIFTRAGRFRITESGSLVILS